MQTEREDAKIIFFFYTLKFISLQLKLRHSFCSSKCLEIHWTFHCEVIWILCKYAHLLLVISLSPRRPAILSKFPYVIFPCRLFWSDTYFQGLTPDSFYNKRTSCHVSSLPRDWHVVFALFLGVIGNTVKILPKTFILHGDWIGDISQTVALVFWHSCNLELEK